MRGRHHLHLLAHHHRRNWALDFDPEERSPERQPDSPSNSSGSTEWLSAKELKTKKFGVGLKGEGDPLLPPHPEHEPPAEHSSDTPSRYHPLVDRQLDGMDESIKELKRKRVTADGERREMSVERASAMAHMNDAVGIQREEIRARDIEKTETKVIKKLENDHKKLEATHDSLYAKLDVIMAPKIKHAKVRIHKMSELVNKSVNLTQDWESRAKLARDQAVQFLRARREALKSLRASEQALAAAKRQHEEEEKKYRLAKMKANGKVEAFRFTDTEYKAALEKKKEREAAMNQAQSSVRKLKGIFEMEARRIDQALAIGKTRLDRKLRRVQRIKAEAGTAAKLLRERYTAWQAQQRKRAAQAAEKEAEYKATLKAYADKRREVFESAQSKAGERAEAVSDWAWDDWAWSSGASGEGAMATSVSLDKPLPEDPETPAEPS